MVFCFEVWDGEDELLAKGRVELTYGCELLAFARALLAASGAGRKAVRCDLYIDGPTGPGARLTVDGGVCYG